MVDFTITGEELWRRMERAVEKVNERLRMKLNAFRDKDRVHLRDMIGLGLIDGAWPQKYPEPLRTRLQDLLNDPDG